MLLLACQEVHEENLLRSFDLEERQTSFGSKLLLLKVFVLSVGEALNFQREEYLKSFGVIERQSRNTVHWSMGVVAPVERGAKLKYFPIKSKTFIFTNSKSTKIARRNI